MTSTVPAMHADVGIIVRERGDGVIGRNLGGRVVPVAITGPLPPMGYGGERCPLPADAIVTRPDDANSLTPCRTTVHECDDTLDTSVAGAKAGW